jgi:undecaprenyl-phosphate 4-deoxy-4-formamido-L-arabinose transferase
MSISVVIPVYNSEPNLCGLVSRLESVLKNLTERFELILVNDASRDSSWNVICELSQKYDWVHGIDLMRNYGQHNALLCGIRAARHDVVVTMDDDLQHPPEEIPKLLEKITQGFDVVYGTPKVEQHGFFRDLASQTTKIVLQKAMGAQVARKISAFRAFRAKVRDAFANYNGPFVSIDVLLTWGTTSFAAISVEHHSRRNGTSNYTLNKLLKHALNMMTGFSTLPLQLASIIGFTFTLFGFGILTYVVGRYFIEGGSVPGFPFLASILAIFSGAQLCCIGIIGEYLARMYFRMMDQPSYTLRNSTIRD